MKKINFFYIIFLERLIYARIIETFKDNKRKYKHPCRKTNLMQKVHATSNLI